MTFVFLIFFSHCKGNVKYSAVRHNALTSLDKLTDYLQGEGPLLHVLRVNFNFISKIYFGHIY